jgi:hypothetical protein
MTRWSATSGNDSLVGGFDNDIMLGGPGNDFAVRPETGDVIDLDGGGFDGIVVFGTDHNDVISRRLGPNGAEVVIDVNGQMLVSDYLQRRDRAGLCRAAVMTR